MMPAAALFAAVFTVGPLARHSELTAAKAGGVGLRQPARAIFPAPPPAALLCYVIGEWSTEATPRQLELQKERQARNLTTRYNFVYRDSDRKSTRLNSSHVALSRM